MIKKPLYTFLLTLLPVFGSFCTREQAGVISETTNGATLTGQLTSRGGTPRSGAVVELRSIDNCDGCVEGRLFSEMTDETGEYVFNNIEPGAYVVFSSPVPDSAAGMNVVVSRDDSEIDLPETDLQATESISGTVTVPDGNYPVTIALLGTGLKVTTDLTGNYSFGRLPRMEWLFRITPENTDQPPAIVPASVFGASDTFLLENVENALLDNFDDTSTSPMLYPFIGRGTWYLRVPASMTVTPPSVLTDFSSAFTTENAWKNRSLLLDITSSGENSSDLFIIGMEIGKGYTGEGAYSWFDLSDMTFLTFMARGSGTIRVLFLSRFIKENYSGADHFEKKIELTAEWREVLITPADLSPPDGSDAAADGIKWEQVKKNIAEITFISGESAVIGIDELTIKGLTFLDLIDSGNR